MPGPTAESAVPAGRTRTLAQVYRHFGEVDAAGTSPLHARVAVALSESDAALRAIEAVPARKRHPTVILAALHDLALAGRAPALAAGRQDDGMLLLMPAGTEILLPEAQSALEEYLTALGAALPRIVRGIYLTGSAVLGDWQPQRSDLDILTVTERPLDDAELAALETLHAGMPARPYRDAVYIPAAAVGARPTGDGEGGQDPAIDRRYSHAVDGVFHRARYRPDPVLWATLHRHGLTVHGPEAHTLGADPGETWLRDWNHGNLESYWRRWAAKGRDAMAGRDPAEVLPDGILAWAALGPGRLHATITTGEIISKTAAADYTAKLLPQHAELLARAKAYRLGSAGEPFTIADGYAACDLVDAVVNDAASLAG